MGKLVLTLLLMLLAGCGPLLPQKPEVSLAGIELQKFGLLEQRFILELRLTNPGDSDITIDGLEFELEVNGRHFASGVSNRGVTVPRLSEAILEVTATSDLASLLGQVKDAAANGGSLPYRLHGTLSIPLYGRMPFEKSGDFRAADLLNRG